MTHIHDMTEPPTMCDPRTVGYTLAIRFGFEEWAEYFDQGIADAVTDDYLWSHVRYLIGDIVANPARRTVRVGLLYRADWSWREGVISWFVCSDDVTYAPSGGASGSAVRMVYGTISVPASWDTLTVLSMATGDMLALFVPETVGVS